MATRTILSSENSVRMLARLAEENGWMLKLRVSLAEEACRITSYLAFKKKKTNLSETSPSTYCSRMQTVRTASASSGHSDSFSCFFVLFFFYLSEFLLPSVEDIGRFGLTPFEVVDAVRLRPVIVHLLLTHQLQHRLQRFRPAETTTTITKMNPLQI